MGKIYTILIYLMIIPILVCIKKLKNFTTTFHLPLQDVLSLPFLPSWEMAYLH